MDSSDNDEHDMYLAQLREVFQSCDQTGSDRLDREELLQLCDKLQLEDQSEYLVNELLKDKDDVDFDEFKDSFVNILCQMMPKQTSSDEDDEDVEDSQVEESQVGNPEEDAGDLGSNEETDGDEDDKEEKEESSVKREMSPKYVVGEKRYGRKSMPFTSDDFTHVSDLEDDEDIEVASSTRSLKHSLIVDEITDTDEDSESQRKRKKRDGQDSGSEWDGTETFEAEGQLNQAVMDREGRKEEEYVRQIWNNLGVGQNGYINIEELARVCNLIGMEKMNDSELQQLFNKLDADGDGRVSFQEFLSEMFQHNTPPVHNAPPIPRSVGTTPTRAQSAQKKLKFPGAEDRTTPSVIQGTGVSGLFSTIDPDKTGFAKPDAITDLWEKYSITNGADVLLALGFDLNGKVNLSELSTALEQELLGVDEQNLIFQAAAASFQQEIRQLKSALEQSGWATEKLRLDLSEANARNNLLAKEVDERHASMEKSSESKLLTIEKKYQDQVKGLQTELDRERENFSVYTAKHKHTMEREMEELKQEEAKLREHLVMAQKEIEKVGHELEEVTGQLEDSERQNQRLQRELGTVEDLHRKLAEFERQGIMNPEELKFTQDKLQRLEQENKDLKDCNDELTAEMETLKLQVTTPGRKMGPTGQEVGEEPHTPIRKDGSILSDYIRPNVIKRASSSTEYSDDEGPGRQHYFEDDNISLGSTNDKEKIEQLRHDIQELKDHFEIERKEIEQAYRLEISAIEDKHDREKGEFLSHIEKEKAKIAEDFERLQQQALAELAKELQTNFAHEKEELVQKHATEKNHLEQMQKEEREQLIDRLNQEHDQNLKAHLEELASKCEDERYQLEEALTETEPVIKNLTHQKEQLESKLKKEKEDSVNKLDKQKADMEGMLTRHMQTLEDAEKKKHDLEIKYKQQLSDTELRSRKEKMEMSDTIDKLNQDQRELQRQKAELELELNQQRKEMEVSFRQEKQEIQDVYTEKVQQLEEQLRLKNKDFDKVLDGGVDSLPGKIREEFFRLVEEKKEERLKEELKKLTENIEKKQSQMVAEFETKQSELSHVFEKEKSELAERYEAQIEALRAELVRLQEKLEEEREALAGRFQEEKECIEGTLAQQIREELEEEFLQQMEEIKEVFDDERHEFETQAKLLKEEVEDLQAALEKEVTNRKKTDELKRANLKLQQEKRQAEKAQAELRETLEETKRALEERLEEVRAEREETITAVRAQYVETSKQSGKDKAVFDMVVMEKEALEKRMSSLTTEIVELTQKAEMAEKLQRDVESLTKEKNELASQLKEKIQERSTYNPPVPEHAQRAINELTQEKSELEERLVDTQSRLEEAEEMAKKYTHLQRKYEDVSRERDKATNFAKSLKEQLNQASTASREDHKDKGRLAAALEEKKQLEAQLQAVSDKLLEATTNFGVSQSAHIRELQQLKEQSSNTVDLQKYTKLQIDLVDNQRSLIDLQEAIKNKEETSGKVFNDMVSKHTEEKKELETQKGSIERRLKTLQQVLDGQLDKFKDQFEASERRNSLLVDLYKENADLVDNLYHVEQQKKDAVARCYRLEDQCNNLKRMLKRVAKVAIT